MAVKSEILKIDDNGVVTDLLKPVENLVIPDGVTEIGCRAFVKVKSLKSVAIPPSVKKIGKYSFALCINLSSVDIKACIDEIPEGAFNQCSSLESIVIPESVKKIGGEAFFKCHALSSVVIPDGVEEIDFRAFQDCSSLASINIPSSVKTIDKLAFSLCISLSSVIIPEGVTFIGGGAFSDCDYLSSVVIPKTVAIIGDAAFSGCKNLLAVEIPESITEIRANTFEKCKSLTSVIIPESVTEIGEDAFQQCLQLASVTIPKSVTKIGEGAFSGCRSLSSVVYKGSRAEFEKVQGKAGFNYAGSGHFIYETGVTCSDGNWKVTDLLIENNVLVKCYNTKATSIIIPEGVTKIASLAFESCNIASVTIPSGLTEIKGSAFENCKSLSSVTIPSSVKELESNVFGNCISLSSVIIEEGATKIGYGAFRGCQALRKLSLPSTIEEIDTTAFENCGTLKQIESASKLYPVNQKTCKLYDARKSTKKAILSFDPNLVEEETLTIENGVITKCKDNAVNIVIPETVTEIGKDVFQKCELVSSVEYKGTVAELEKVSGKRYFDKFFDKIDIVCADGTWKRPDYLIENGVLTLYSGESDDVVIPDAVCKIGYNALRFCYTVLTAVIPASVTEIEELAFVDCEDLNNIKYLGTIAQWQSIKKARNWAEMKYIGKCGARVVHCIDGDAYIV